MAAGVALDHPVERLAAKVKHSFRQNPTHVNDLSPLPILSIYQGKRINTLLQSVFPDTLNIEDLWINFFCITSDMACNGEVVHTRGPLWKAVRASASLPGIFPLVRLGDGLHVDGAFLNSLPVDVMADLGAKKILAVDFSWLPPATPDFDDVPGPLDFLKERFLRREPRRYPVPTLLSGLVQSSLLASSRRNQRPGPTPTSCSAPTCNASSCWAGISLTPWWRLGASMPAKCWPLTDWTGLYRPPEPARSPPLPPPKSR